MPTKTPSIPSKKKSVSLQEKFEYAFHTLNSTLIERPMEIQLVLSALIAQEHALLIGAPGSAKSLLVESLSHWITDTNPLTIHCCKDTTRNVAFGPVKMSSLKLDKMDRILEGGAADAHLLVLEEVFKAGPAVLDMFLMLMNERVYREGLVKKDCPLRLLMGCSNEWSPEGCETALAAFFDRFLFRKEVKYIKSQNGLEKLLFDKDLTPHFTDHITLEELDDAHEEAMALDLTDEAAEALLTIIRNLRSEGIFPSDRRLRKSVKAIKAFAYLQQKACVDVPELDILAHVLWVDPLEQPLKTYKIVGKVANPLGVTITDKLMEAEDIVVKNSPTDAVMKLKTIQEDLLDWKKKGTKDARLEAALQEIGQHIKTQLNLTIGISTKNDE